MSTPLQDHNTTRRSDAAPTPNLSRLSLAETMDMIRWDIAVNRGWSFDHLRAWALLIEVRLEQYIYGRVNTATTLGKAIWGLTRFAGSVFQWLLGHCNIPGSTRIGRGLRLPHPQNIVIAYLTDIGEFCTIYHDVSIVWNGFIQTRPNRPRIGNRVLIGAKVLIIGDLEIGDDVLIGAGTIVPKSVPAFSRVTNQPARIQHRPISADAIEAGTPRHLEKPYDIWL